MMRTALAGLLLCCAAGSAAVTAGNEHLAEGVVKSIDANARTVTIAHGPISSMGMGAMIMAFRVADPAMLDDITPGRKIKFLLVVEKSGQMVVTDVELLDSAYAINQ